MSPYALAATTYARRGLAVFPLRPHSKKPMASSHGFHDATTDLDLIAWTVRRHPRANIGIACEPSGVVVVDRDDRNGGEHTLDRLLDELGLLPHSWAALTSNGVHHYFRAPAGVRFVGKLGPGIDIKHDGYVVAPPSVGPSGRTYTWEASSRFDEVALAPLPPTWLRAMTDTAPRAALPSSGVDAKDSHLGACFAAMGWLGAALPDGRRMVRCPWVEEHSDDRGAGDDTSAVIFPRAVGATLGGFRCLHGHCATRSWRDVLDAMPLDVRARATKTTGPNRSKAYALGALARATANIERGDVETLAREAVSLARFVWSGEIGESLVRRALLDAATARGLTGAAEVLESVFVQRRAS